MKTKAELRDEVGQPLRQQKVARFPGEEGRIPNFGCAAESIKPWQLVLLKPPTIYVS